MNIGIIHTQSTYISALEHALQTPLLVGGKQLDVRLSCPDDFSNVGVSQQRLPDNRLSANNSSLPSFGEDHYSNEKKMSEQISLQL